MTDLDNDSSTRPGTTRNSVDMDGLGSRKRSGQHKSSISSNPQFDDAGDEDGPGDDRSQSEETESGRYNLKKLDMSPSVRALAQREDMTSDLDPPPDVTPPDPALVSQAMQRLQKRFSERNVKAELVMLAIKYEEAQCDVVKHNNLLLKYKAVIKKLEDQLHRDSQLNKAIWFADASRKETKEKQELVEHLYHELEERGHETARKDEQIKVMSREIAQYKSNMQSFFQLQDKVNVLEQEKNTFDIKQKIAKNDLVRNIDENNKERQRMKVTCEREKAYDKARVAELENIQEMLKEKIKAFKESHHQEIKDLKAALGRSTEKNKAMMTRLELSERKYRELDHESVEMDKERGKCKGESEMLKKRKQSVMSDLQEAQTTIKDLQIELSHSERDVKYLQNEVLNLTTKLSKAEEKNLAVTESLAQQNTQLLEAKLSHKAASKATAIMESKLQKCSEVTESLMHKMEAVVTKQNLAATAVLEKEKEKRECNNELKIQVAIKNYTEKEYKKTRKDLDDAYTDIMKLSRSVLEIQEVAIELRDENVNQLQHINNLQKHIEETEYSLKMTELLEQATSKKNNMLKTEIKRIEDMMGMMEGESRFRQSEVNSLLSSGVRQDIIITRLSIELNKTKADLVCKNSTVTKLHQEVHSLKEENIKLRRELNCLQHTVVEIEADITKEEKATEAMTRKRDYCMAMAKQRQVEVGLLMERTKWIESKLKMAAAVLTNKNNDIRVLILEVKNLRRLSKNHKVLEENLETLREDYIKQSKQLIATQTKLKALEEEKMQRVHPHRKLRAVDPSFYELHLKANLLTKKLVNKTIEVTKKEEILIEKNILYLQLRTMVMRREPTSKTELWKVKKQLQEKERKVQGLQGELSAVAARAKVQGCHAAVQLQQCQKALTAHNDVHGTAHNDAHGTAHNAAHGIAQKAVNGTSNSGEHGAAHNSGHGALHGGAKKIQQSGAHGIAHGTSHGGAQKKAEDTSVKFVQGKSDANTNANMSQSVTERTKISGKSTKKPKGNKSDFKLPAITVTNKPLKRKRFPRFR